MKRKGLVTRRDTISRCIIDHLHKSGVTQIGGQSYLKIPLHISTVGMRIVHIQNVER